MGIDTSLQKDLQRSFDSLRPQMRSDFWSNPRLLMYGRQNTKSLNLSPESVFQAFGFNTVDSMDISDFEGANIIHDLNYPIPKNLEQKYNCVFDGGSSEHVFDVKTSLFNTHALLKVGGIAIHAVPMNNFINHGFYQFSPALFFGFYEQNGYKIHMITFSVSNKIEPARNFYGAFSERTTELGLFARIVLPQTFTPADMVMMTFVAVKPEVHREPVIPQQPIYSMRFSGEQFRETKSTVMRLSDIGLVTD